MFKGMQGYQEKNGEVFSLLATAVNKKEERRTGSPPLIAKLAQQGFHLLLKEAGGPIWECKKIRWFGWQQTDQWRKSWQGE